MAANHPSLWKRIGRQKTIINENGSFQYPIMYKLVGLCMGLIGIMLILSLSGAGGSETFNLYGMPLNLAKVLVPVVSNPGSTLLGETIKSDQFEIVINSIETEPVIGTKYNELRAAKGYIYVVVNWQYTSILLKPVVDFPSPSIRLLDADNNAVSCDFSATEAYASQFDLNRERFKAIVSGSVVEEAEVYLVDRAQYKKGLWRVQTIADTNGYVNIIR